MKLLIILYLYCSIAHALGPVSTDSIQLQQLVNKSEQQILALKEILKHKKQDRKSLEQANRILSQLVAGIDTSIEKYQGTKVYEEALLRAQEQDNYKSTYSESQELRKLRPKAQKAEELEGQKKYQLLKDFQKDSVRANKSDLEQQQKLQQALNQAGPGFVPKIETQAAIGNWKASTRLSTQLTELLSVIHAMREELRILRANENKRSGLNILLTGSEEQNKKQREGAKK